MKHISPRYQRFAAGGLLVAAVLAFIRVDALEPRGEKTSKPSERGEMPKDGSGKRRENDARAIDPSRALDRAFALEKGSDRDVLVRELLSGWAARDAEAALGWVSSMEDSAARRSARSTVCLAVAEEDPPRAVVLALAHGADQGDDGGLLECLTMQWCERECETVLDWVRGQPPGEWRERLLARASSVLSRSDPGAAARLVSNLEPGNLQDEAVMAVLHQWALQDSAAALQWAEAFSEPTLRERALVEISNLRNPAASYQVE